MQNAAAILPTIKQASDQCDKADGPNTPLARQQAISIIVENSSGGN